MHLSGRLVSLGLVAVLAAFLPGCDWISELPSGEGDTDGDTDGAADDTGGDDGADGQCTHVDDYCSGQDVIESCNPETRETSTVYCAQVCGANLNFTCIEAGGGVHGCWCVVPGKTRIDGCADLERCLADCDGAESCSDRCFGRTDASTIRLYGALIHCAEVDCKPLCDDFPEECASCVVATKSGLYGDCSVERAACDQDDAEAFPWPQ